ncbi:MAG: methionyl-tRNA synthetase [Patescibacteria group bacterium]|nr:methionyl-tRNA synthetase [Patescibacteria group bacterium]
MSKSNNFYITTTLPYVNADPHIGHAMEFVRADVIARFQRSLGKEVFFNTGTDEHGQKIWEGAEKENLTPQEYVDKYSERFKDFLSLANISYDAFIRTTDQKHIEAAKKMWQICLDKGDIYKAKQKIKYCVGCEMEKTDSELNEEGRCPDHPNRDLVITEEENYFFRFSKYQKDLLALYERGLVKPESKQNEIKNFVSEGLHDFSVSRLKTKMPWGVEVPNDQDHVMYVWFDALNSYISTLNWGIEDNSELFQKFWTDGEVVQYCGKDNNKSQSAIWQAMLFSTGLKNSDTININGHIISGGVKMSKSIGNVISPFEIVDKYKEYAIFPEDVLRFMMCHEVSTYEDSDVTKKSIDQAYAAYLQNGIGNQVNRILKLSSTYLNEKDTESIISRLESSQLSSDYSELLQNYKVNEALHMVTDKIKSLDEYIQEKAPFKLIKSENEVEQEEAREIIRDSLYMLGDISHHLYFFMPNTSMKIYNFIKDNQMPEVPLFNRI